MAGSRETGWEGDDRAVRAIRPGPGLTIDTSRWPATVPAVEQLLCEGLDLPPGVTVLVGENGSGKSTVMEMLAEACGLNPQGAISWATRACTSGTCSATETGQPPGTGGRDLPVAPGPRGGLA